VKELQTIPLTKQRPNPHNPRKDFDPQALEELAKSIRELGLLQEESG
jgi:ParB family chromosome partitioning protein